MTKIHSVIQLEQEDLNYLRSLVLDSFKRKTSVKVGRGSAITQQTLFNPSVIGEAVNKCLRLAKAYGYSNRIPSPVPTITPNAHNHLTPKRRHDADIKHQQVRLAGFVDRFKNWVRDFIKASGNSIIDQRQAFLQSKVIGSNELRIALNAIQGHLRNLYSDPTLVVFFHADDNVNIHIKVVSSDRDETYYDSFDKLLLMDFSRNAIIDSLKYN